MKKFISIFALMLTLPLARAQSASNTDTHQAPSTTPAMSAQNQVGAHVVTLQSGEHHRIGSASSYADFDSNGNLVNRQVSSMLPKINVLNFGADPTGNKDSYGAFLTVKQFLMSHPTADNIPNTIYVPAGLYKIKGSIVVGDGFRLEGDGPEATVIQETDPTANLITINGNVTGAGCINGYCANQIDNLSLQGSGHTTTGTILEMDNTAMNHVFNVTIKNHGGRGIQLNNSERNVFKDVVITYIRWPIIMGAGADNENEFDNVNINAAGITSDKYCYNINCVNGVYPSPNSQPNAPDSWGANKEYREGDIIFDGRNNEVVQSSGSIKGNAWVIGVSGSSAPRWNATIGQTSTDGSLVWRNIGHRTVMHSDTHAAWLTSGQHLRIQRSSIKPLTYLGAISSVTYEAGDFGDLYTECFTGPCIHPAIGIMTWTDKYVLTSGLGADAKSGQISNASWFPGFVNDPSIFSAIPPNGLAWQYRISPPDADRTSNAVSSCGRGLLKNQYEMVQVSAATGDGIVHIISRNYSGSTAPANTAWCPGSYLTLYYTAQHGGLNLHDSHLEGINLTESKGYTTDAGDHQPNGVSGDIVLGPMPDGQDIVYPGAAGGDIATAYSKQLNLNNVSFYAGGPESAGQGWMKSMFNSTININGAAGTGKTLPTQSIAQLQDANIFGFYVRGIYYPNSAPVTDLTTSTGMRVQPYGKYADIKSEASIGGGITASVNSFLNAHCTQDIQPNAQNWIRECLYGGPDAPGGYKWELDGWNGSAWINMLSINLSNAGTSSLSASQGGLLAGPAMSGAMAASSNKTVDRGNNTLTIAGQSASKVMLSCGTATFNRAARSNPLACTWVTTASKCTAFPSNAGGAGMNGVYAVKSAGAVQLTASVAGSGSFDVSCSAN